MTTRLAAATGNFTTAGTWMTVDGTSLNDSEAANTALTAAYVTSSTFTPGAIVVDGIAIKIASRAAGAPSNTITVALDQAGADVAGTVVTMNVADIDVCGITIVEGGWYYFKFATPVTLVAATLYSVKVKLSATTTAVSLYSLATTNWSRMLATTTTGAPAAGDNLHIMGDNTGAGTAHAFTVTMDNTATTSFGTIASSTASLSISKGGTLAYGTTASTAYYLRVKGMTIIYSSGIWKTGTSAGRMPSSSSAVFEFDCTAVGDSGFDMRSATVDAWGDNGRTSLATLLTANTANLDTTLTVGSTAGWQNSDELGVASTSRTANQFFKKVISSVTDATHVVITAAMGATTYSGTSPTQADVINLTRNVIFRSNDTAKCGYMISKGASVVNMDYVQIKQIGTGTANKRSFDVQNSSGSVSFTHGSIFDNTVGNSQGFVVAITGTASVTFSHNQTYNVTLNHLSVAAVPSTASFTADDNVFIGSTDAGNPGVTIADVGCTFTNATVTSMIGTAMNFGESGGQGTGTFGPWTLHSNAGSLAFNAAFYDTFISAITVWRSNARGVSFNSGVSGLIIDSLTAFGNTTANLTVSANIMVNNLTINSFVSNGDSSFATTSGLDFQGVGGLINSTFNAGDFSTVTGIKTAHTQDILLVTPFAAVSLVLNNTKLGAATEITGQSFMTAGSYIASEKHDATAANHKMWKRTGIVAIETGTVHTGSQSMSLTPNNAAQKLDSAGPNGGFLVAVNSGDTVTPTIWINKAAAYNGNQPRLILKRNDALGITADAVIATYASGTGSWNQISGTTAAANDDGVMEFVIDCDGTAGVVYVDSLAA